MNSLIVISSQILINGLLVYKNKKCDIFVNTLEMVLGTLFFKSIN